MTTDHVYNLIILDESGSMGAIKNSTISGFNEVVQTIKGLEKKFPEQKHFISLVTFNGLGIKTKLDKEPVSGLVMIDENTHNPDSLTPLYDAIALSVLKLRMDIASVDNAHVLVTILTDGEENDSREFSGVHVKKIIEEQKARGWTFTYIGANHDVEKAAASISVSNTINFVADNASVKSLFVKENQARVRFSEKIHNKIDPSKNFYDEGNENPEKKEEAS
jgi:hypothetical protein